MFHKFINYQKDENFLNIIQKENEINSNQNAIIENANISYLFLIILLFAKKVLRLHINFFIILNICWINLNQNIIFIVNV